MSTVKYQDPITGEWLYTGAPMEVKGMTMDLLWTNPNPSTEFLAQDVTVSFNKYDYDLYMFVFYYHTSELLQLPPVFIGPNDYGRAQTFEAINVFRKVGFYRGADEAGNENKIWFTVARAFMTYANGTPTEMNSYVIPAKIYGLKNTPATYPEGGGTTESIEHPGCFYRMVNGVQEWLNPPMELGVEYKTTERYLGKPVYVKTFDCGALPDGNKDTVTDIVNYDSIVGISGYAFNPTNQSRISLPYVATLSDCVFISWVSGKITTHSVGSWSAWPNHNVTVKYTKTTD